MFNALIGYFFPIECVSEFGSFRRHCTHYKSATHYIDPNSTCQEAMLKHKFVCCRCDHVHYREPDYY